MDLKTLVQENPVSHNLPTYAHSSEDMKYVFEAAIDLGLYVLIDPHGNVTLYPDPERPIPLNVIDMSLYREDCDDEE